jgi:hypothetical protein
MTKRHTREHPSQNECVEATAVAAGNVPPIKRCSSLFLTRTLRMMMWRMGGAYGFSSGKITCVFCDRRMKTAAEKFRNSNAKSQRDRGFGWVESG